jgi:hypothetical protein
LSPDGCKSETAPFEVTQNTITLNEDKVTISPNPTRDQFSIQTSTPIDWIELIGVDGRQYNMNGDMLNNFQISHLAAGEYIVHVITKEGNFYSKITKM